MHKTILALGIAAFLAACGSTSTPMNDTPGNTGGNTGNTGGNTGNTGGNTGNTGGNTGNTGGNTGNTGGNTGNTGGGTVTPPPLTVTSTTIGNTGDINAGLENGRITVAGGLTPDGSNGFSYLAGVLEDQSGIAARAQVETGVLRFTPIPAAGTTVTIPAKFSVGTVSNARRETIPVLGDTVTAETAAINSQPITLTATFDTDTGTLTGSAGGLVINGRVLNQISTLNGTVSFNGVAGELSGFVGGAEAIGAFNGSDATSAYAGGFVND